MNIGDEQEENYPPTANDDTANTNEETAVWIDILTNDFDIDGTLDPTTITITNPPNNGNTNINTTTGEIQYTPNTNYYGTDTFTYTVNDNDGATSNTATVNITINPINDPPIANNDYYTTNEDNTLNILAPGLLQNDTDIENDILTAIKITDPLNGTITIFHSNGSFTYIPNLNYNGIDSFTYKANDSNSESNIATVYITIHSINDPPVVSDIPDQTIDEGQTFNTINLDDYVSDPDNTDDQINWTYTGNTDLTVTIDINRIATINIPDPDWYGTETITFNATDPLGLSDEDPATFTVNNINDPPVTYDDYYNTIEDTTLNIPAPGILSNDIDADNDSLVAASHTEPTMDLIIPTQQ